MDLFASSLQLMDKLSTFSNAKINLVFAVNGIRSDGFCDITSIMIPVDFGDHLTVQISENAEPETTIEQRSNLKFDEKNNSIEKAVELFSKAVDRSISVHISIDKKIPIGSGLGGGSSNATSTLLALNQIFNFPLSALKITELARKIGTDCAFFVQNIPQLASGRGDILSPLPPCFATNLKNYSILLFCPSFSISTTWAYEMLKKEKAFAPRNPSILGTHPIHQCVSNAFESVIFQHYPEIKGLFLELKNYGLYPAITGSGSCCFLLEDDPKNLDLAQRIISKYWGKNSILAKTHIRT